jgi:hypothetical protein
MHLSFSHIFYKPYPFNPCFYHLSILKSTPYLLHGAEYYLKSRLSLSLSKNILLSLWNPKVRHRVHKSPPLDPILSQLNQVRTIDPCPLRLRSSLMLFSTYAKVFPVVSYLRVSQPKPCKHLPHMRAIVILLITKFSLFFSYFNFLRFKCPSSVWSSLRVRGQVSHPDIIAVTFYFTHSATY